MFKDFKMINCSDPNFVFTPSVVKQLEINMRELKENFSLQDSYSESGIVKLCDKDSLRGMFDSSVKSIFRQAEKWLSGISDLDIRDFNYRNNCQYSITANRLASRTTSNADVLYEVMTKLLWPKDDNEFESAKEIIAGSTIFSSLVAAINYATEQTTLSDLTLAIGALMESLEISTFKELLEEDMVRED